MPIKLAILDDYQGVALDHGDWESLSGRVDITVFRDHLEDEDALAGRLEPFDAIVAMRERTQITRPLLERLPNLRLLVTTGMNNVAIDMDAARDRGVVVSGTRGSGTSTPELTWGLILALARAIPSANADMHAGAWQRTVGTDLAGATLGVLGLGRLGTQVARIGQAFGMHTLAWSQNLDADHARAQDVEPAPTKQDLLERADFLTIHLRLSERTTHLIGSEDLARMKPTAFLINTSRGPIVDEHALVEALQAHKIAGAALDVYDAEPLPPDHPLREQPNVVLTPHLGYVTRNAYDVFYAEAQQDVAAWLDGAPIRVLNRPATI